MNRKRYIKMILVVLVVVLAGVMGYLALVYKPVTINITEPPKQIIPPVTNQTFQTSPRTATPTDLSVLSLKEVLSQPRKFDGKTITIDA